VWSGLQNTVERTRRLTTRLQNDYDAAGVPLRLSPGGELSLRPEILDMPRERIPTYGAAGKYVLTDIWADELPGFFEPVMRHLQSFGFIVVLAHPERMQAVQDDPELVLGFLELGLLLQGNLQCFSDPENSPTRRIIEQLLLEDRLFLLGSDTHRPDTLPCRLAGLQRAITLAGDQAVAKLTMENPRLLLPP
jgi:protein-tyrosine phosphatase